MTERKITMHPATIHALECALQIIMAEKRLATAKKRLATATRKLNNALTQIPDVDTAEYYLAVEEMKAGAILRRKFSDSYRLPARPPAC